MNDEPFSRYETCIICRENARRGPPVAVVGTMSVGLGPADALTLLLTVESLLLAALAAAVALMGPQAAGGRPIAVGGGLAALIAAAITMVAVGAGAAWSSLYITPGPRGLTAWIEAIALAVGIIAGPLFSWGLWSAAK